MAFGLVLSDSDLEYIHQASLRILERVGVKIEHEKVRERLLSAGALTGPDSRTVRFPKALVEEYLALAPREVRFAGAGEREWRVGPGNPSVYWTAAAMNLVTGTERREFDRAQLARLARLVDSLPHLDGVVGVSVCDVPPTFRDFAGFRVMASNTRKHVRVLSFTPEGAGAIIEMALVLLGGKSLTERPVFSMGFTAHGPLRWTHLALDVFFRSAGHGIPLMINGEPMAGATSPVTLAGAATVGHAEILSGIVLNQVLEPGRPCLHNLGFAHVMDMRTGVAVTGGPENCLLAVAGAQLARFCGLPSASWISTDSMLADSQSAAEKTLAALTHSAAGVGLIWGAGTLESELSLSFAQCVIDNDIIGQVKRYLRGVQVSEETVAENLISGLGPGGEYLTAEHTLRHFSEELYETDIFCRSPRERWEQNGSLPLAEAAGRRAEKLISENREPFITPEQDRDLEKIEKKFSR